MDIIVVMAGYDEWWTSFPDSVREVAEASRQQGARTFLVLNFREGVGYVAPDGRTATEAFERNNATLREFTESGEIPELVVGDWYGYTSGPKQDGWLQRDGIHLTRRGASAVARVHQPLGCSSVRPAVSVERIGDRCLCQPRRRRSAGLASEFATDGPHADRCDWLSRKPSPELVRAECRGLAFTDVGAVRLDELQLAGSIGM